MKIKQYIDSGLAGGGILVSALLLTNFLNFVFNAYLGRVLSLSEFSILTLVNTLWFFVTIFLNSMASTTNNRTAYLSAKRGVGVAQGFRSFIVKRGLIISLFISLGWVMLIPLFNMVFHISSFLLFLSVAPAISLGIFAAVNRGHLQGVLSFSKAAVIITVEGVSKLLFAFIFVSLNLKQLTYLSIPLSIFAAFVISLIFFITTKEKPAEYKYVFPRKLLFATFLTVLSATAFLSIDLLLARHFLTPVESGEYSLLSLIGKMIFFIGSLFNIFIITLGSRDAGLNKNSSKNFYKILSASISLSVSAFIALGLFGNTIVPLMFGAKSELILEYLTPYTFGILLFTIATAFATYHLARQQFIFAYNGIFITTLAVVGMMIWHASIYNFVSVIVVSSCIYLASNLIIHIFYKDIQVAPDIDRIEANLNENNSSIPKSVSVCIPAYNEAYNIDRILTQIFEQKQEGFYIEKIVVASDGSTDDTVKIAKQYKDRGVEVIEGKKNRGQTYRQNEIIRKTTSDVLVLLNADIVLGNERVILRLVKPILDGADLSAHWARPLSPKTFMERILYAGFALKHFVYTHHKKGDNIYTCIGHMRALSKRFYSTVQFPKVSDGEDQYLYLMCISKGFVYKYAMAAKSYFKLPDSFEDYKKYAKRIFQTQAKYSDVFSEELATKERSLPKLLILHSFIRALFKYHINTLLYVIIHVWVQRWALRQPFNSSNKFEISRSTKNISIPD